MDVFEFLGLGAELSIAIAGFAGIIATFQFTDKTKVRRADAVGLMLIVQCSLVGTMGFILPLFLFLIEVEARVIWATASVYEAVLGTVVGFSVYSGLKGTLEKGSAQLFVASLQLMGVTIVLANVLNAMDMVFHREPGPFIAAGVWVMGLSGFMFSRLLLRPIWRFVRQYETTKIDAE